MIFLFLQCVSTVIIVCIIKSTKLAGYGVNSVQVVMSRLSMRLLYFVYVCTHDSYEKIRNSFIDKTLPDTV